MPLRTVRDALVLAAARRTLRSGPPLLPVRTLHYFLPVIEEILEQPPDPGYVEYLDAKLKPFEWSSRGRPQRGVRSRRRFNTPEMVSKTCDTYQVGRKGFSGAAPKACFEALEADVRWVRAYLRQARPTRPTRWSVTSGWPIGSASFEEKGGSVETVEGAFTAARELLDLAFRLKAVAVQDKLTAALDEISKAAEPLERLKEALLEHDSASQGEGPATLSDKQVVADLRLATERILVAASRLQEEEPPQGANSCNAALVWCFGIVGSGTQEQDNGERRVTNARIYLVDAYAASKRLQCFGDKECQPAEKNLRRSSGMRSLKRDCVPW